MKAGKVGKEIDTNILYKVRDFRQGRRLDVCWPLKETYSETVITSSP